MYAGLRRIFKMCVQTTVTASFEAIVSFLRTGIKVRVSFVHFVLFFGCCSFMASEVEDTGNVK